MKKSELKTLIRECIEELNEAKKKPVKKYTKAQLAKAYKQIGNFDALAQKMMNMDFSLDTTDIIDNVLMSDWPIGDKQLEKLFDLVGMMSGYDHKSNNLSYFVKKGIGADVGYMGPFEPGDYDKLDKG